MIEELLSCKAGNISDERTATGPAMALAANKAPRKINTRASDEAILDMERAYSKNYIIKNDFS